MAQIRSKGTLYQATIASVLTTIAQAIALTPPGKKSLSYDSSYFDQSGVGKSKDMTGWAEGNDWSGSLWWDPALASHMALDALITTPTKNAMAIVLPATPIYLGSSTPVHTISWVNADLEMSPKVEMEKAVSVELKGGIDGLPTVS